MKYAGDSCPYNVTKLCFLWKHTRIIYEGERYFFNVRNHELTRFGIFRNHIRKTSNIIIARLVRFGN